MADESQLPNSPHEPAHAPPGYERTDARLGGIVWAGVGLTVITIAVMAACVAIFRYYVVRTGGNEGVIPPLPVAERGKLPPAPVLEGLEKRSVQFFDPELDTPPDKFDWVDKKHGIVSVPMSVAMRAAAKQLSGAAKPHGEHETPQLAAERTQTPSAASSGRVLVPASK
jgi:hypothetical protein